MGRLSVVKALVSRTENILVICRPRGGARGRLFHAHVGGAAVMCAGNNTGEALGHGDRGEGGDGGLTRTA